MSIAGYLMGNVGISVGSLLTSPSGERYEVVGHDDGRIIWKKVSDIRVPVRKLIAVLEKESEQDGWSSMELTEAIDDVKELL